MVYWVPVSSEVYQVRVAEALIECYWDEACTRPVTSIDWGTLYPGQTKNVLIYVLNAGGAPISLTLSTANWNPPEAELYLTLSWDYDGRLIYPRQVLPITLSLTVSLNVPTTITDFSFDIIISGYTIGGLRALAPWLSKVKAKGRVMVTKIYIFS
ncbi:MAG: hypothetical protein QW161_06700 [Candidatus Bathyarchaeia archaeon]